MGKLIRGVCDVILVGLLFFMLMHMRELSGRVDQLQANQAKQIAAYNDLARIVQQLEVRLGIPPAKRVPIQEQNYPVPPIPDQRIDQCTSAYRQQRAEGIYRCGDVQLIVGRAAIEYEDAKKVPIEPQSWAPRPRGGTMTISCREVFNGQKLGECPVAFE